MKSRLNSAKEMPPSAGSVASSRRTACIMHTKHILNGHGHRHADTSAPIEPTPAAPHSHSCSAMLLSLRSED